jgi:hypothetical protein
MSKKNKAAQELGRLVALKGGIACAAKTVPEEGFESARKAAKARRARIRQRASYLARHCPGRDAW